MSISPYSGILFRRNAVIFLSGKVISAILTLITLLCLVRMLSIEEYGTYVILVAGLEIILVLSSFGLPWLTVRYLPEFKLNATTAELNIFVLKLVFWNSVSLLVAIVILKYFSGYYLSYHRIEKYSDLLLLYLIFIFFEGLFRSVRESMLTSLMAQRSARLSLLAKQVCFLLIVVALDFFSLLNLKNLIVADLASSLVGFVLSLTGLTGILSRHQRNFNETPWTKPNSKCMWKTSIHMYLSHVLSLGYSPHVFVQITSHYFGIESAALFGFVRNIYTQISGYLPITIVFAVLRPMLIARSLQDKGRTIEIANLFGKTNFLVLAPLLSLAFLDGQEIVLYLSGDNIKNSGNFLFFMLLTLIPFSQRQIIETVAVSIGNSILCMKASFLSLIVIPITIVLISITPDILILPIAMLGGELIFCVSVLVGLCFTSNFSVDMKGYIRILIAGVVSVLPLLLDAGEKADREMVDVLVHATAIGTFFILALMLLPPFRSREIRSILKIVKWKKLHA